MVLLSTRSIPFGAAALPLWCRYWLSSLPSWGTNWGTSDATSSALVRNSLYRLESTLGVGGGRLLRYTSVWLGGRMQEEGEGRRGATPLSFSVQKHTPPRIKIPLPLKYPQLATALRSGKKIRARMQKRPQQTLGAFSNHIELNRRTI